MAEDAADKRELVAVAQQIGEARRATAQARGAAGGSSLVVRFATVGDDTPAWWSPQRDKFLANFWPTEDVLAGALYSVVARNSAFRYEFNGPPKDVAAAQRLFALADLGAGWQTFIEKCSLDLLCLAGPSRVALGGDRRGQTKSIRQIVRDRDAGPVLTIGSDGCITERPITEWHKTPLGNRRWWWISLRHSMHSGRQAGGLFMTEDHPVLTARGWLLARDVRVGDLVATVDPQPSDEQMEMLTGTLLGDGCVGWVRNKAILRFSHCADQEAWLNLKLTALKGFRWTGRNTSHGQYKETRTSIVGLNSLTSAGMNELRGAWYPSGKKIVARDFVERYFSPRMLATWFMDDGTLHHTTTRLGKETTPHASFYTDGFTRADVEWLVGFLTGKGLPVKVYFAKKKETAKVYPYLHVGNAAVRTLMQMIGAYVPPEMRYKVTDAAPAYDPMLWQLAPATAYYDEVIESGARDHTYGSVLPAGNKHISQTTYHIGVEETRNFVAANMVVHNTQDNGAFIEVIRPARAKLLDGTTRALRGSDGLLKATKSLNEKGEMTWGVVGRDNAWKSLDGQDFQLLDVPEDLPVGLAHLDAQRCERTGDDNFPVVYFDVRGVGHRLSYWQVILLEDFPSPREEMHSVGWSAVSRALRSAQILRDIATYRREKISGRFIRAIHLTNADADAIQDQIEQSQADASNRSLLRYIQPLVVSTLDPGVTPAVVTLDLASMPDGFDEESAFRHYIGTLALALGVDYGFLAPLPGGGLGTATQTETMDRQSRGKSSRLFMQLLTHRFNYGGVLPESVTLEFKQADPAEEAARDTGKSTRAATRAARIASGEITAQVARQIAQDEGDLDQQYLTMMQEADVSPKVTVDDVKPADEDVAVPASAVTKPAPDAPPAAAPAAKPTNAAAPAPAGKPTPAAKPAPPGKPIPPAKQKRAAKKDLPDLPQIISEANVAPEFAWAVADAVKALPPAQWADYHQVCVQAAPSQATLTADGATFAAIAAWRPGRLTLFGGADAWRAEQALLPFQTGV